ncbi:MAG: hypothetical protein Q8R16_04145, partial [bacterium]|nr:hypothetical protein [bacterium]
IGCLRIAIGFDDGSIAITAVERLTDAPFPHPSVSSGGIPYLGPLQDAILRKIGKHEFASVLQLLLDFLEEPPTGVVSDASSPARWPEVTDAVRKRLSTRSARVATAESA